MSGEGKSYFFLILCLCYFIFVATPGEATYCSECDFDDFNCLGDCTPDENHCGVNGCEPSLGETCNTCPSDCGSCQGGSCNSIGDCTAGLCCIDNACSQRVCTPNHP